MGDRLFYDRDNSTYHDVSNMQLSCENYEGDNTEQHFCRDMSGAYAKLKGE